jgi:hypothetical protein
MEEVWTRKPFEYIVSCNDYWKVSQYIIAVESMIGRYLVKRKRILGAFHGAAHMSDTSRPNVSV